MTPQESRTVVLGALAEVAPEVEATSLVDQVPLRDQVDLDSMDWLRFLAVLEKQAHVTVPESDYANLVTLDDVVAYVAHRTTPA